MVVSAGWALERIHYRSLLSAERQQAEVQLHLLIALPEQDFVRGEIIWPQESSYPPFNLPDSGVYALVTRGDQLLWVSPSLQQPALQQLVQGASPRAGEQHFSYLREAGFLRLQQTLRWAQRGEDQQLVFTVLHSDASMRSQQVRFRGQLWSWLGGILLAALIIQALFVRWGLAPLRRLEQDLHRIHRGEAEQLDGRYPLELQPVTDGFNRLICSERQQRERYRNTMADLAHSLKTPLAVIAGAHADVAGGDYQTLVDEQVQRMNEIVQYQLKRPVGQRVVLPTAVAVAPLLGRIKSALETVYASRAVEITLAVEPSCHFWGDEGDLMELVGNLTENACKYGGGDVLLRAREVEDGLELSVEDDGPGVPHAQEAVILRRGARLDTSVAGQGIGLAVVVEIVSGYGGEVRVSRSATLGGACFTLILPRP